jgi:hypothetical protein
LADLGLRLPSICACCATSDAWHNWHNANRDFGANCCAGTCFDGQPGTEYALLVELGLARN